MFAAYIFLLTTYSRYVSGLDGLKRLQTVRFDDETLITPELNVYQALSSADQPRPTTGIDPQANISISTGTSTASLEFDDYSSSQPSSSTHTATLDDLSVVSTLLSLGSLPHGSTVPGFPDSNNV